MDSKVFRAEMLQKYGGKMKDPPYDPEGVPAPKKSAKKETPKKVDQPPVNPLDLPNDMSTVKKANGGTASSRADGCAQRGKTRGKMV